MQKIKLFLESDNGKDILTVIIIILVGLGSFGLGRLSKNGQNEQTGVNIEYPDQEANVIRSLENNLDSKNFFASKKGSKYYSASCSAGKTIKEENKIYFKDSFEAEKAGYELSDSCR
jgi:hypothetical protein